MTAQLKVSFATATLTFFLVACSSGDSAPDQGAVILPSEAEPTGEPSPRREGSFEAPSEPATAQPSPAGAWKLTDAPILSIGSLSDSTTILFDVVGAVRLSDGRIIIADGSKRLSYFDPAGGLLTRVGGPGSGPGEFQRIQQVGRIAGDSVFAIDSPAPRGFIFSPSGEYVRSFQVIRSSSPSPYGGIPFSVLLDGTVITEIRVPSTLSMLLPGTAPVQRAQSEVIRFDPSGRIVTSLATVPGDELLHNPGRGGAPIIGGDNVFSHTHVVAGEDRVYLTTSDEYEIRVLDLEGVQKGVIRRDRRPGPLTRQDLIRFSETWLSVPFSEEDVQRLPEHQTVNAIAGMVLADDGTLWVEEFPYPRDGAGAIIWDDRFPPRSYSVFGPDGEQLAELRLPPRFRPTHFGKDFVLGVWRDALDVEYVRMYGILK